MRELSEIEKKELKNDLIEWKKSNDMDWSRIEKLAGSMPSFANLFLESKELFFYTLPLLIQEAKKEIEASTRTKGISVKKTNWLWKTNLQNYNLWNNFCKMMSNWSSDRMNTNIEQSLDIVNSLVDPKKIDTPAEDSIRKGLVYGNVQSGKTAHIASIIAMYASAGCKLIIVLSGVTKSLRQQTQDRLRNDLGIDKYGGYFLLTSETDLLSKQTQRIEGLVLDGRPVIGIFKKSPAALKRLYEYLNNVNSASFWNKKQVLIIDDECDQYSINVKPLKDEDDNGNEFERSTINRNLIKILNTFERYCYIGFTATPFANVLNELPGKNSLYPKDFIYALDMNDRYYGAKKIFGSSLYHDPEKNYSYMDVINYVEDEEISPKIQEFSEIPQSLKNALFYFILSTSCKYSRGYLKEHSTMLIHLDLKISTHFVLEKVFKSYFKYILENYKKEKSKFKEIWDLEKKRNSFSSIKELFSYNNSQEENYKIPCFEELEVYINQVINKLSIVVDNSAVPMEDRLHYSNDKSDVIVVIGGNTLSRGLTLEGLIVSVFYRTSNLYDTLLQMGRWFGYRIGYEDLARIYTTKDIAFKFSELADIEEELRDEFTNYSFDITPEDVAVKIRKLPSLQITRKNAMQSAVSTGINYSGHRPQTLFFPRNDKEWLDNNVNITSQFLDSIGKPVERQDKLLFFSGISIEKIIEYIKNMNILEENSSCNKEYLLKFLHKAVSKGYLKKWNVIVMSNQTGDQFEISSRYKVNLIERSRIDRKDPDEATIYIKILQQPNNMLLDTDLCSTVKDNTPISEKFILRHEYFSKKGLEEPGLLVIYPIKKDSQVRGKSINRLPLDLPQHIMGLMLTFPNNKDIQLDDYMTIELDGERNGNDN